MERSIITITPANILTIWICAALGYGALVFANMALKKYQGGG